MKTISLGCRLGFGLHRACNHSRDRGGHLVRYFLKIDHFRGGGGHLVRYLLKNPGKLSKIL